MRKSKQDKILETLPARVVFNDEIIDKYTKDGIFDSINEYLSEKYGFCPTDFTYSIKIEIDDICWDLDDIDE